MRKPLLVVSYIVTIVSMLFGAYTMHKSMDEEYQAPTFAAESRVIVTVQPELIEAAQAWTIPAILFVSEEKNPQIRIVPGSVEGAMAGAEATRHMDDDNHITHCDIQMNDRATHAMLTHEIGHCLGLSHEVHNGGTNMYRAAEFYQQGWSDTVTDFDRANLARLYAR